MHMWSCIGYWYRETSEVCTAVAQSSCTDSWSASSHFEDNFWISFLWIVIDINFLSTLLNVIIIINSGRFAVNTAVDLSLYLWSVLQRNYCAQ